MKFILYHTICHGIYYLMWRMMSTMILFLGQAAFLFPPGVAVGVLNPGPGTINSIMSKKVKKIISGGDSRS